MMSLGFPLFAVFGLLLFMIVMGSLTGILLLMLLLTRSKYVGIALGVLWAGVIGLIVLALILNVIYAKKVLTKEDYYGEYVIDRSMFAGVNADWQYNSFRFEVKPNDSIFFHVTDGKRVIRTHVGSISTLKVSSLKSSSARLVLHMAEPRHHVLWSNPTIYRYPWSFHLVFRSPLYHNMYFKKGRWKPLKR